MKKILFLFPGRTDAPIGGYKVVFEYCNRLVADNYDVGVVYPSCCQGLHRVRFLAWCKAIFRFIVYGIIPHYSSRRWFPLDKRVKEYWVYSLKERNVPKADVYVATAVQTAYYLAQYNRISPSCKFYFIQHFEDWGDSNRDYVLASYHLPLRKWVIASWLKRIVEQEGENCILIPNGFDFSQFHITVAPEARDENRVCMLYHSMAWKGCADGFKALEIVKKKVPDLRVTLFGVLPCPDGLPDWYEYCQQPSRDKHRQLYNEAAVFLGTSHSEGWGLTVGEAMACGCAVVCTDNPGYLEMAEDENTALVVPVGDVQALADRIIRLIQDDNLRFRIACVGHENILQFMWGSSYVILRSDIERTC